jgi:hypothetical protein
VRYDPDPIDPSENVLVVYNADSTNSTALAAYYQANRPGMANANYLRITGINDATYASASQCASLVSQVIAWTQANSSKPIRYIIGLRGLPSRDDIPLAFGVGGNSVSYMIYSELLAASGKTGYIGGMSRFSVAEYGAPLVAWLDCGSYASTYAYINKEIVVAAAGGLQSDGITISGSAAGVGGSTYYLDDTTNTAGVLEDYFDTSASGNYYSALVDAGVSADDIVHHSNAEGSPIATLTDPTAYGSWGYHTANTSDWYNWPTVPKVTIELNNTCQIGTASYHAGWWIGMSVESFNGVYGKYDQGDPVDFFAASAFASGSTATMATINGTDYSYYANTPICWVGSTNEPAVEGCEAAPYFERWSQGWSTIEAAWAGLRKSQYPGWFSSYYPVVVTDPFLVA